MAFPLVNPLVYLQFTTIHEFLVTFGPSKWFLRYEDPFMIFQITTCFKCLATIAAGKWLLSYVGSVMLLQTFTLFKSPLCINAFLRIE